MEPLSAGMGQGAAGSILAVGVEVNRIRACLLEQVGGSYRLAAWQALPRRSESSLTTIGIDLCRQLGEGIDRALMDESALMPLIVSEDSVRHPPLDHVTVAASPRPHVRVWIVGLSLTQSMDAARDALTGCPAHIIGYTALAADVNATRLADTITVTVPDLVVMVGGFDDPDSGTHQPLVELGRLTGQVVARLAPAQRPAVIYAGNRWAAPHVAEAVLAVGGGGVEAVANVQPAPGFVHKAALAQACNFHYWRLSRRVAGFRDLSRWVTPPGHIVSQESSFAQLVQAWREIHGMAELHALYCAPAWWLHVWAGRTQFGVNLRYVEPQTRPVEMEGWPALQLVSGEWPDALWSRPEFYWWDRSAMAPFVGAVGQIAPQAMLQVMRTDLLRLSG